MIARGGAGVQAAGSGQAVDWDSIAEEIETLPGGAVIDLERVRRFAREIGAGRLHSETNRLRTAPQLPGPSDLDALAEYAPGERARLERRGRRAIERGEVGVAVLAGGMATRFGARVKGVSEVIGGRSFLEIKRAQARRFGPVPFVVMTSFASHRATLDHLGARELLAGSHLFMQSASLRLTPEGALFRDGGGRLSPYAPGHGEFAAALRTSGALAKLARGGVRLLVLSNVDNLGAELDPTIVGYHLSHGKPLSAEVTEALPGDTGGVMLRVADRLQVVEGLRLPLGFDFGSVPFVNINSFAISLDALDRDYPLRWFYVEKAVDGRRAVQLECLVGELTAFLDTAFLEVPRFGPSARYYPVKTPEDLEALRADPALAERFGSV
jgi:UTP--glucose-1-phosphate uridylyltransferase